MHAGTAQRAHWVTARAVPMPRRDPHGAVPLPALGELARHCAARLHTAERVAARRRFSQEFEPLLDALCASFAARGLRELAGDQPIEPRALIESGRIAASSAPMLRNLLQLLAEDGVVQPIAGQWLWRTEVALPKPEDIWMSLVADYPEYASLTARVGAAGLHLAERLRAGTLESAVRAVHPDGVSAWADGCTHEEAAGMMEALSDVIRSAAAVQPAHARLRVLRFVGAFPAEGLPLVPEIDADRCDMVIGTASQTVLDDLRGRWPAIDTLECRIVDLDGDPAPEQPEGIVQSGGYDIVVLGEGVADAPDPSSAPQERAAPAARRWAPGSAGEARVAGGRSRVRSGIALVARRGRVGRAIAPAPTGRMARTARAARVRVGRGGPRYPGGSDRALRIDRASGQHARRACAAGGGATQPQTQAAQAPTRTWLIARDAAGYSAELGQALGAALAAAGQRVVTVIAAPIYERVGPQCHALDPCAPAHWERLLAELKQSGGEPDAWIHLVGLDLRTAGASAEMRAAAQEARAAVFAAWLQTCARSTIRPDAWVIAAHAGTELLPDAAQRSAAEVLEIDRLRDAALWGLARVAMQEFADRRIRWLDLHDPIPCTPNAAKLAQEMLYPDAEDEILLTTAGRYVPRFTIAARPQVPALLAAPASHPRVQLDCSVPGPFRNLKWRTAPEPESLGDDEVEIEVRTAGLNFRDVMYAMGLLPDEAVEDGFCGPTLGMEVAGIVTRVGAGVVELAPSDAVIAFAPASFANHVRTRALAVARKPAHWSFAAAATVPSAFFTAYYALHELAPA